MKMSKNYIKVEYSELKFLKANKQANISLRYLYLRETLKQKKTTQICKIDRYIVPDIR